MWIPNILPEVNNNKSAALGLVEMKELQLCPVNDSYPLLLIISGANAKRRPKSKTAKFGISIIFQAILTDLDSIFTPHLPTN